MYPGEERHSRGSGCRAVSSRLVRCCLLQTFARRLDAIHRGPDRDGGATESGALSRALSRLGGDAGDDALHVGSHLGTVQRLLAEQVKRGTVLPGRPMTGTGARIVRAEQKRRPVHSFPPCRRSAVSWPPSLPHTKGIPLQRSREKPFSATRVSMPSRIIASPMSSAVWVWRSFPESSRRWPTPIPGLTFTLARQLASDSSSTTAQEPSSEKRVVSAEMCGCITGPLSAPGASSKTSSGVLVKGIRRHPIVKDEMVICCGTTDLGRVRIGKRSVTGGNGGSRRA